MLHAALSAMLGTSSVRCVDVHKSSVIKEILLKFINIVPDL